MNRLYRVPLLLVFLSIGFSFVALAQDVRTPVEDFEPETYIIYNSADTITVDGMLDEEGWQNATWTNSFTDIQGSSAPDPRFDTRVKMLWDDNFLYIAAMLEEPHIWAKLTERDAVIFMDNNFEVFIDPDGDTHNYYELEVNALGTFWDLMLTHPYRNGGMAIDAWDIKGLKIGIEIQGTLNDPSDTDEGWTVEMAIPWNDLEEASPDGPPSHGSQWRVNFSRVEWQTNIVDGDYVKQTNPDTGENLPEDNWSWSPQGLINMHFPEMWGYVQFSDKPAGSANESFEWRRTEDFKWLLRQLYYRQVEYKNRNEAYTTDPADLNYENLFREFISDSTEPADLTIQVLGENYLMQLQPHDSEYSFYIRSDSKVWQVRN